MALLECSDTNTQERRGEERRKVGRRVKVGDERGEEAGEGEILRVEWRGAQ